MAKNLDRWRGMCVDFFFRKKLGVNAILFTACFIVKPRLHFRNELFDQSSNLILRKDFPIGRILISNSQLDSVFDARSDTGLNAEGARKRLMSILFGCTFGTFFQNFLPSFATPRPYACFIIRIPCM